MYVLYIIVTDYLQKAAIAASSVNHFMAFKRGGGNILRLLLLFAFVMLMVRLYFC